MDASGIHATVTGVVLGLMTPTTQRVSDARMLAILNRIIAYPLGVHWSDDTEDRKDLRMAEVATRETLSPIERLEMKLHPWIGFFVMLLFAFANAGVPISFAEFGNPVTLAVFVGFTLGKPAAVLSFSWLAVRMGIATRPLELSWLLLTAGGVLAGIGFTMALFIANLAFSANLINAAKVGILSASVVSAMIEMFILFFTATRTSKG